MMDFRVRQNKPLGNRVLHAAEGPELDQPGKHQESALNRVQSTSGRVRRDTRAFVSGLLGVQGDNSSSLEQGGLPELHVLCDVCVWVHQAVGRAAQTQRYRPGDTQHEGPREW